MLDLRGKTVLITGGAGGLGLACARLFKREGASVVLWDVDAARGAKAAEEGFRFQAVDAVDPAAVRAAAAKAGPVDILMNNAGVHYPGDFVDADDGALMRQVGVNLGSYIWCARAILPGMIARGSGHLVYTASAAGLLGVPGMAVYSATKHAVIGLAESIRLELRRGGHGAIGTTIVCPSFIDTGMFPNSKPPLFTPWLKPEDLAAKIVSAVKENKLYLHEPAMVSLIPLLKTLPRALRDCLCRVTGMDRSLQGK